MKTAFLITFSQTVRVIVDGNEPSDTDIEKAFVKASEAMMETNVESLEEMKEDKECPYGTFDYDKAKDECWDSPEPETKIFRAMENGREDFDDRD